MGTRSLIRVFNNGAEVACIYQQFDGYPSSVGAVLADFLRSRPFVNGISDNDRVFNGMGCFACQFIAAIKTRAGGVYLYPAGSTDVGEEYVYEVRGSYSEPGGVRVKCLAYGEIAFDGDIDGFAEFCSSVEA